MKKGTYFAIVRESCPVSNSDALLFSLCPFSTRALELEQLSSNPTASDDFDEFYKRLTKIKEYHYKYPDAGVDGFELELEGIIGEGDEDEEDCKFFDYTDSRVTSKVRRETIQPSRCCSLERKAMGVMSISTRTTWRTTI
jgi:hypothetical protein